MTNLNLTAVESGLAARARELTRSLAERNLIAVERSADAFDDALLASARDTAAQTLSHELRLLREIEAARERLRAGTYGICTRCEEEIAPKRLQAIPWAACCVSCQAAAEGELPRAA